MEKQRKIEEEEAAKKQKEEEKKMAKKKYRESCKEVLEYCLKQFQGNPKFDKFYLAEVIKKYPLQEDLDAFFDHLKGIDGEFEAKFTELVNKKNSQNEEAKK